MHTVLFFGAVAVVLFTTTISAQRWLVARNTDPEFLLKLRRLVPGNILENIETGEHFCVLVAPPDGVILLKNQAGGNAVERRREKIAQKPVKFRIIARTPQLPHKQPASVMFG